LPAERYELSNDEAAKRMAFGGTVKRGRAQEFIPSMPEWKRTKSAIPPPQPNISARKTSSEVFFLCYTD